MGTIRYAVRLRGRPNDAAMAALPEELDVTIDPVRSCVAGCPTRPRCSGC